MIFSKTNQILNEVYFGETKEIKELLETLHDFRYEFITEGKRRTAFPGSNSHPKLLEFSEKIEDLFGFGAVDIHIINKDYKNAFTQPVCYSIGCEDPQKHIHSNSKGFYFDKKFNYAVIMNITSNIILNQDFTDREVLAIILHEIGHSFVIVQKEIAPLVNTKRTTIIILTICDIIMQIMQLNTIGVYQDVKNLIGTVNGYKLFKAKINKALMKTPIGKATDAILQCQQLLMIPFSKVSSAWFKLVGLDTIAKALTILLSGYGTLLSKEDAKKVSKGNLAFDRSMEYFSDNFAASYGFGMDLTSALRKMEFSDTDVLEKISDKISKLNPLNLILGEYIKIPYYEICAEMGVHPSYANRVNKIQQDLKKELAKNNINPKLKKELMTSIKEIDDMKDKFKKLEGVKKSDPNSYKQIWMAALMDEDEFLNSQEKDFTSMEDRDEMYKKLFKEHTEWFNSTQDDYDPFEFI